MSDKISLQEAMDSAFYRLEKLEKKTEWKLAGESTGNVEITLPENFEEIKFITVYKSESNPSSYNPNESDGGMLTKILTKDELDSCKNSGINKSLYLGDGYMISASNNVQRSIIITDYKTIKTNFYWGNRGDVTSSCKNYLYFK